MITSVEIDEARRRIGLGFLSVAETGEATRRVQAIDPGAAAVGQHMDGLTTQRGLHGTAAAIQVLASENGTQTAEVTRKLVHYVELRASIESTEDIFDIEPQRLAENERNTIKTAELLYALARVPTGIARREDFATLLATRLTDGHVAGKGWGYYLAPDQKVGLLPTAFAVLALDAHAYEVPREIEYIRKELGSEASMQTDLSVQIMALYVLCFSARAGAPDKMLRGVFDRLWKQLSPLLSQDLESNIEYMDLSEEYPKPMYVRVPWQLYLIACAAKLAPYRRFAGRLVQKRLGEILRQVLASGGLIYPHSGSELSTRTNAILYEVLGNIKAELEIKRAPLRPFELIDKCRSVITAVYVIYAIRAVVFGIIVVALAIWLRHPHHSIGELSPELISAILLMILTARRDA